MPEIALTYRGDLAEITLNRPSRKNALRAQDWRALRDAAQEVARGPARAVLLRGEGGGFCSGFDIAELEDGAVDAQAVIGDGVNPALRAIRAIGVPTIAAANGACVGGGLGIAAACDIVLASETTKFGAPYVKIGIMADAGLHTYLRDAVGYQRASHLIFSGKLLSATEALALGLCAEVLPADGFDGAVEAFAQAIAAGPTAALVRSKHLLQSACDADAALDAEARLQAEVFATSDAREGIRAFITGTKPVFTGR